MNIKARPTVYNGIQMRSRLEARMAAYLDSCGFEWTYEPRAYATRSGQYLPDFEFPWDGGTVYLEVKGPHPSREGWDGLLDRMEIIRHSEPEAMLAVVSDAMLRTGRFAINLPDPWGWREAQMVRCPDHPDRVHLRTYTLATPSESDDRRLALWCRECDPERSVYLPWLETVDHWVTERDIP